MQKILIFSSKKRYLSKWKKCHTPMPTSFCNKYQEGVCDSIILVFVLHASARIGTWRHDQTNSGNTHSWKKQDKEHNGVLLLLLEAKADNPISKRANYKSSRRSVNFIPRYARAACSSRCWSNCHPRYWWLWKDMGCKGCIPGSKDFESLSRVCLGSIVNEF